MIKKLAGIAAGGLLMVAASASQASVLNYDGSLQTYTFDVQTFGASTYSGRIWIGVSEVWDTDGISSTLQLSNFSVNPDAGSINSVDGYGDVTLLSDGGTSSFGDDLYELKSGVGSSDDACYDLYSATLSNWGGDCSYLSFDVVGITSFTFDWMMTGWDDADFAFALQPVDGALENVAVLANEAGGTVSAPSTLALLALGLIGTGCVARRKQQMAMATC